MFKALTGLIDNLFKPVNAFFSKLFGAALPAQGGSVLGQSGTGALVDRLPDFVIDAAPTPLTALPLPTARLTALFASSPIQLALDESRKATLEGAIADLKGA